MIDLRDSNICDILPYHLSKASESQALGYALKKMNQRILGYIDKTSVYAKIDEQKEDILDLLALEFRSQYYDEGLPIQIKRELIKNTLIWYQKAGTVSAVEELICTIFGSGRIQEWFEYGGTPYCFKVFVDTEIGLKEFIKMIRYVQNTRSHMEAITINNEPMRFLNQLNFRFRLLDFFSRFYNLSEGNILDGRTLLDGSWNLGTIYHKGLAFHEFEVAAFFNNHFGMAVTDDFCLQSENMNWWSLDELLIGLNTILEQNVTGHMDIRLRLQNSDKNQMAVDYQVGMMNDWSACNLENLALAAVWENGQKNSCQETNMSFSVTNSNQFGRGGLTMDSIWYLDGSFPLNGTRNLKTEWNEEDI